MHKKPNPAPYERAIDGAALAPLSNEEKRNLAMICRDTFELLGKPGGDADAWRHQQTLICVERHGLRECRHEDYDYIKAYMLRLQGHTARANRVELRAATESRRQALAKLRNECRDAVYIKYPMQYVRSIAKSKFKTADVERELSAKQIWQLVFSLRSAEQRRKKGSR